MASEVTHPTFEDAPFTWFVVTISQTGGGWQNIFSTNDAPWSHLNGAGGAAWRSIALTNTGYHGWATPSDITNVKVPQNVLKVLALWFDGTTIKVYHGSELRAQHSVRSFHTVKQGYVVMGMAMQNHHDYKGYIGEVAAYTKALPEADLLTVVNFLEQKWSA